MKVEIKFEIAYEGHGFNEDTEPLYFNSFKDLCNYVMNPLLFEAIKHERYGREFDVLEFKKI